MKITDIKLYRVPPRWLFLKIETDEGLVGWGEPVVEGRAEAVRAAVEECRVNLIGANPLHIEDIWQTLYRGGFYRGGPVMMSAIAGIDQALWDIKGKFYNAPVHELLGGAVREKMRVYQWVGGDRPHNLAEAAKDAYERGFTAIKVLACEEMNYVDSFTKVTEVLERIASVRDALGYKMEIGIDFHGRVHKSMAKVLAKELEQYHPMFIEEPVLAQQNESLRDIAMHSNIPIATGERMFSRWDFKKILQEGYVDIIQPDPSHAGGISECHRLSTMAEAYDVSVAFHSPLGPVALAAALQLDFALPNALIQEQSLGMHYNKENDLLDYLKVKDDFVYANGYMEPLTKPGLGVEVDEEYIIERSKVPHDWKANIWRLPDGSITEW